MRRIAETFAALRSREEAALIPYLMAGYPSMDATRELLYGIVSAGADLVELGIPFSDPLADGATLQKANQVALERGANLHRALELVASVRGDISVPLVLMSYYNPLLQLGDEGFARAAAQAGVDGVIVPDLPAEECSPLETACANAGLALVGMVAPTSSDERIAAIAKRASGFLYCVSLKGVTGARSQLSSGVDRLVERVRRASSLPAVVGFGISTVEQVRAISSYADGAVVASALLDPIDANPTRPTEGTTRFVAELKGGCRRERAR